VQVVEKGQEVVESMSEQAAEALPRGLSIEDATKEVRKVAKELDDKATEKVNSSEK
jgi:hypothetical protein